MLLLAARPTAVQDAVGVDIFAPLASLRLRAVFAHAALPAHPTTLRDSWALGTIEGHIDAQLAAQADSDGGSQTANDVSDTHASAQFDALLARASHILGVEGRVITLSELRTARRVAAEMEQQRGLVARVLGFLSFTRILWFFGMLGVLLTIGPVLFIVAQQIRLLHLAQSLLALLVHSLKHVLLAVFRFGRAVVMHPVSLHLHQPLLLALVFLFYVHCLSYRDAAVRGLMMLLGAGIAAPIIWFMERPSLVPGMCVPAHMASKGLVANSAYCAVLLFVTAYLSQSSLISYLGVVALYQALGFVCGAFGMSYFVGFHSRDAIGRNAIAALATVVLTTVLTTQLPHIMYASTADAKDYVSTSVAQRVLHSFTLDGLAVLITPAQVLSQIVFYLAMLISSDGNMASAFHVPYFTQQLRMMGSLLLGLFVGSVYGIASLQNTAIVFAVLYAMDKSVDWGMWSSEFVLFNVFGASLLVWRGAFLVHTHPALLMGLFTTAPDRFARMAEAGREVWSDLSTFDFVLGVIGVLFLGMGCCFSAACGRHPHR